MNNPTLPESIRLMVITDAVPERNGVGSYYSDLVDQLRPRIGSAEMIHPLCKKTGSHRYLTAPLPGDSTQRIALPRLGRIRAAIKEKEPNVIIVPTPGPFGLAGLFASRRHKIPMITGFHTHYEALADIYWRGPMRAIALRFLMGTNRLLFKHSFAVLANSPAMCDLAIKAGARNTQLMGTSVSSEFLNKPLQSSGDKIQSVLFAGRLAGEKNIPAIINAAKEHIDIQFTIAGDGPLRSMVDSAAQELPNLSAPGWINRNDLIEIVDNHDILLLPSHVESFGTVALEGMARGKIVIVSKHCGLAEWEGLVNATVQVQENESAADALRRVRKADSHWRLDMTRRAAESARAINQWNTDFWIQLLISSQHPPDKRESSGFSADYSTLMRNPTTDG